jgi:hypothetical protein
MIDELTIKEQLSLLSILRDKFPQLWTIFTNQCCPFNAFDGGTVPSSINCEGTQCKDCWDESLKKDEELLGTRQEELFK